VTRSDIKRANDLWNTSHFKIPMAASFLDCGDMSALWLHGEEQDMVEKSFAMVFEQCSQSDVVPPHSI
jgi:hypothetical protein